jgi:hypothetical protein
MAKTTMPEPGNWIFKMVGFLIPALCSLDTLAAPSPKDVLPVQEYVVNSLTLPIEGKIKEGKIWIETGDTNVAVITEVESGNPCDSKYIHRLLGYRFAKKKTQWATLWKIRDQATGCLELQYFDSTLQVIDVDGNGIAETVFFYSFFGDGTDPQNLKMIFHFNGSKMPIRGLIPRTEEDSSAYEVKPDPKLKAAPLVAQRFAMVTWKGFLSKNFKEELPVGALK